MTENYAFVCREAAEILGVVARTKTHCGDEVCESLAPVWGEAIVQTHESARAAAILFENRLPIQAAMISRQTLETAMWIRWASSEEKRGKIYINKARGIHIAELKAYTQSGPEDPELESILSKLSDEYRDIDMKSVPKGVEDIMKNYIKDDETVFGIRSCIARLNMAVHGDVPSILRVSKEAISQSAVVSLAWSAAAMHEGILLVAQREKIKLINYPSTKAIHRRLTSALG